MANANARKCYITLLLPSVNDSWQKGKQAKHNRFLYCKQTTIEFVNAVTIMSLISFEFLHAFAFNCTVWLTLCLITIAFVYNFILKNWWFFTVRNVPFVRGLPLVGCIDKMIFGQESFAISIQRLYKQFPNDRFFGIFELTQPVYVVRDPELIKEITVQKFEHFTNHQGDQIDPILARTLFFLKNQQWRDMRTVLSPAFTGNKMRSMFRLIYESTDVFMKYLIEHTGDISLNENVFELKDTFTRFTSDVIASCAFGLEMNSMENRDNGFYHTGKNVTNFDGIKGVKLLLFDCIPTLMKIFRVHLFETKAISYFRNVVKTTIDYREKSQSFSRPDLINLLIKAKAAAQNEAFGRKSTIGEILYIISFTIWSIICLFISKIMLLVSEWHDDDLVAQCLIFFFAGFETVSTLMCFMAHELAMNPPIQSRLYNEIMTLEKELNGSPLTYEHLQKMTYLDMVVMETLRRWPPIASTDRAVTKSVELFDHGNKVILTKEDNVWLPIFGIHTDEQYYPNPYKFDPERFSEENKGQIQPGTYLPFGNGQRSCIASRFATMEAKTMFYYLLKEFHIEKCDKTPDPLVLKAGTINMTAESGFWVKLSPRKCCIY